MAPVKRGPKNTDNDKNSTNNGDWGEWYAELLCHTSMRYDEIGERSLAQLNAILVRLPKHIEIKKISIPGMYGGIVNNVEGEGSNPSRGSIPQKSTGKPPKLSEIMNFCAGFGGGGA
jgi:hypothetical protein